jgi:gliding motility-associated-like protein
MLMLFFGISSGLRAQQFSKSLEISLPDTLIEVSSASIDLDNDGLLDLALLSESAVGGSYCMYVKGDTIAPMKLASGSVSIPAFSTYLWTDYDNDNRMDLILSPVNGTNALLYRNTGNFKFESTTLSIPAFEVLHFSDLDNDGSPDCIWSGPEGVSYATKTYKKNSASEWIVQHDSLKLRLADILTVDLNKDGFRDIFMSGVNEVTDSVFSAIFVQEKRGFARRVEKNLLSRGSLADVNSDGQMDVIAHGLSYKGKPGQFIFQPVGDDINVVAIPAEQRIGSLFRADLNSDGNVDEAALRIFSAGDTTNSISITDGSLISLPHKQLQQQIFADMEHDGDLDLIQLIRGANFTIAFYTNPAQPNSSPRGPKHGIAVPVYGHMFFYWEKGSDDHTTSHSISYDFYLESDAAGSSCEFDLLNEMRLSVSHGNNGTVNFRMIRNFASANINYAIQSVDNSLHAGAGSVCVGSGAACVEAEEQVTTACLDEIVVLQAPAAVMWFSLSEGYLGEGPKLDHPVSKNDTLFYLQPDFQGCTKIRTFPISVGETANKFTETLTTCSGASIDLISPQGWTNVKWTSTSAGDIGSGSEIRVQVSGNDVITASYIKSETCTYTKEFKVTVSKPVLVIEPTSAKIVPGGNVTLSVSGAESYEWSPPGSLSEPLGSSPVASPLETTKYTVTGYDSIGCSGTAEATVFVEIGAGFVPSLFTPNADGTNDELRVYGLRDVNDFKWRIFNREGNVVFSTSSVSEALNRGWDGTSNGIRQPNGIYFWRVEGARHSGELLLNGKKEGSFLLIR